MKIQITLIYLTFYRKESAQRKRKITFTISIDKLEKLVTSETCAYMEG
jgi:hypothetical protein